VSVAFFTVFKRRSASCLGISHCVFFTSREEKKKKVHREREREREMYPAKLFQSVELKKVTGDDGPDHALRATLQILRHFPPECQVGITKTTAEHGNTSVSMGCAVRLDLPNIRLLNIGSNGPKLQTYAKTRTGYTLLGEEKPRPVHNFHDPTQDAAKVREEIRALAGEGWFYVFITGPMRSAYYQGDRSLEARAVEVFGGWSEPAIGGNYYLPQETEASLELLAAQTMYRSMGLPVPSLSLGIGGSSVQLGGLPTLCFQGGMNDPEKLAAVPAQFKGVVTKPCVVALKSGCLLRLPLLVELLRGQSVQNLQSPGVVERKEYDHGDTDQSESQVPE
jgi:hypothetical protein